MGDRCDGGAEDLVESVVLLRLEMHSDSGAGFNGRANNLIFVLRHVQTTKS